VPGAGRVEEAVGEGDPEERGERAGLARAQRAQGRGHRALRGLLALGGAARDLLGAAEQPEPARREADGGEPDQEEGAHAIRAASA